MKVIESLKLAFPIVSEVEVATYLPYGKLNKTDDQDIVGNDGR